MRNFKLFTIQLSAITALVFSAAGCSMTSRTAKGNPKTLPATATAEANPTDEPSVRDSLLHSVPDLLAIHFDYDRADLKENERAVLDQNAKWLRSHPDLKIQVAGYCDQRGTEAYNLALGQRRAHTVRQQYVYLGVPAGQIATISYGKEKPICEDADESCWQQNRRAETLVAFPQDVGSTNLNPAESNDLKDAVKNK